MKLSLRSFGAKLLPGLTLGLGLLTQAVLPRPAVAAENIRLLIGGPLLFSVSVDSLDTYAQTGEIEEDLRLFTRFAPDAALDGLQQALQTEIPLTVQQVSNIGYSELGEDVLRNLGKVVRPHPQVNGDRGLRGAMLNAASEARANSSSWTPIDVLKHYPGDTIDIRLPDLLALRRELMTYWEYNQAAIAAIESQATAEATNQSAAPLTQDLTQPGAYAVETSQLVLSHSALRQAPSGPPEASTYTVDAYFPQNLTEPAPVVIISHGYSDTKENFSFLGQHLASHGFVALLPEHIGSDLDFRLGFTDGLLNTAMSPTEFVNRPVEVSHLIDTLEQQVATDSDWAARVDLDRIGMVGHSLGGSTAQALAGAELNPQQLAAACDADQVNLNMSMYLQCQARFLPAQTPPLQDPRIKAVVSANGLSSGLFGPNSLAQIQVPFMMVSASRDVVAPSVAEQVHPFFWLGSAEKYLAIMPEGSHFSLTPGPAESSAVSPLLQVEAQDLANIVIGEHRALGAEYFEALNLAFWMVHLRGDERYRPYLSARYAQQLSEGQPADIAFVEGLTTASLRQAYGDEPPIPFFPEPIVNTDVLEERSPQP